MQPFISNHQFNVIKQQALKLQRQVHGLIDRDVENAVRASAGWNILDAFANLTEEQVAILSPVSQLATEDERIIFLKNLDPFRIPFPTVTQLDIKTLFPKATKLKYPLLKEVDFTSLTYLGWKDIGTSKHYLVYELDGVLRGTDGRYVISTKKGICEICGRFGDIAFMSITKKGSGPENDKAFGKYMCYDSKECNLYIQNTSPLDQFLTQVIR